MSKKNILLNNSIYVNNKSNILNLKLNSFLLIKIYIFLIKNMKNKFIKYLYL